MQKGVSVGSLVKRILVVLILITFIIFVHSMGLLDWLTFSYVRLHADQIRLIVQQYYYSALFWFEILFVSATVAAVPVTALLTVLAGFLFGIVGGLLCTLVGATLGGIILFFASRYVLYDWVQQRYARQLYVLNQQLECSGYWYLLMAQIFPFTPTPLINLLAGCMQIRLWTFVWTTILGIMPGSLLYVLAGNYLYKIKSLHDLILWQVIVFFMLGALLLVLPIIWHYANRKR